MSTVAHDRVRSAVQTRGEQGIAPPPLGAQKAIADKAAKNRVKQNKIKVMIETDRVEKRAEAFLKLGRQLNRVRTPREAAAIILAIADELFPWDACIFDLVSSHSSQVQTVVCVDTVKGKRKEFTREQCSE